MTDPSAPAASTPSSPARWRARALGAGITLFWLGMMFTLVRDEILPKRRAEALAEVTVQPASLVRDWKDVEEYVAVRFANRTVGAGVTRIAQRRVKEAGFTADVRFALDFDLFGVTRRILIRGGAELDAGFDVLAFHLLADLSPLNLSITGHEQAGELLVEVNQGGKVARARYTLERRISLLEAVRPIAQRNFAIRPGATIALPVVDPVWSMQVGIVEIAVRNRERIQLDGKDVEAYRVETRLNELVSTSWVDEKGATLRRQLAGGFFLDRSDTATVARIAPSLAEPVTIPPLHVADFAGVPVRPLRDLADRRSSPLGILDSFAH